MKRATIQIPVTHPLSATGLTKIHRRREEVEYFRSIIFFHFFFSHTNAPSVQRNEKRERMNGEERVEERSRK